MENSRKMEDDKEQLILKQRHPITRNNTRGTRSRYHWLSNIAPFQEITKRKAFSSQQKKEEEEEI